MNFVSIDLHNETTSLRAVNEAAGGPHAKCCVSANSEGRASNQGFRKISPTVEYVENGARTAGDRVRRSTRRRGWDAPESDWRPSGAGTPGSG